MKFTKRNIEDWDFRAVEPLSDADEALWGHYADAVAVDSVRSVYILGAVEMGIGTISHDDQYLVVHSGKERFFKTYTTRAPLGQVLTREGRWDYWIGMGLWREWEKYGRVKVTILPDKEGQELRAAARGEEPLPK